MSDKDPSLVWWSEYRKAKSRYPHPPYRCVSIASSSPIALWYCPLCHQTQLALREIAPTCEGGFAFKEDSATFHSRASNLADLWRVSGPMWSSHETGEESAIAYHYDFISRNTKLK